ncbi:MAG: hypothetical protein Kow0080_03180 [Candidatus Promineifilaceae bacterium]
MFRRYARVGWLAGCVLLVVTAVTLFASQLQAAAETVLYDGALGTLPGNQQMVFGTNSSLATQTITNSGVLLDTTSSLGISAGYSGNLAVVPNLNRAAGFVLSFSARLVAESHVSNDRAGFSVILLGDDAQGVELAFWPDEVFAQDDDQSGGALFTKAETAVWDTASSLSQYQLFVVGDTYFLYADGVGVLNGRVRNYANFSGFPDPYETPNFIFLGDDTTSAQAQMQLNQVTVQTLNRFFLPLAYK